MRTKPLIIRSLNIRNLRHGLFSVLCAVPGLRDYLNFYQDTAYFETEAEPGSARTLTVDPAADYGVAFTARERRAMAANGDSDPGPHLLTYRMARLRDVTVLGSSGVSERSGKALFFDPATTRLPRNWVVARHLLTVQGDPGVTCINLLGVRRGHRHFAHFFWDMMVPVMVYLKHWHDPTERITFLVREDLSAIQRDTYRFLAEDFPNITFQPLAENARLRCKRVIHLVCQNRNHGVDNVMARDSMIALRDLYLRHYGVDVTTPPTGRRLYLSRGDAALRRVTNEQEVIALLAPHGFEVFQTGKMPFREQAALFASAGVIISPHGAGLANLMFCRPGTQVLEVFPKNYFNDCYIRMSKALGLHNRFLVGGAGEPVKLAYSFPLDDLKREVAEMTADAAGTPGAGAGEHEGVASWRTA